MSALKSKLLIITDTTARQTNGVVRTMHETVRILSQWYDVRVINPDAFATVSLPIYPEIDIAKDTASIAGMIEDLNPDHIHISTEGPVGLAGKKHCDKMGYRYSTSYHSKFPEFIKDMVGIPTCFTYPYFKWFHAKSSNVMVPTVQVENLLTTKGFQNLAVWTRGVNTDQFSPIYRNRAADDRARIVLCVSRVSREKGLDDFCSLKLPTNYRKVLVGDGPYLNALKSKYPDVEYVGKKKGDELATYYANADVFIFPSKTDTFGLTQIEAMASGTPVLAYRGTASDEIVTAGVTGYLVNKFSQSMIDRAVALDKTAVADAAKAYSWEECTRTFSEYLVAK